MAADAQFCGSCGRAVLIGCVAVLRVGKSYAIGRHADGGFAVWDQTVGEPEAHYAPSDWPQANEDLDLVERGPLPAPVAANARTTGVDYFNALTVLIVVVIVVIAYLYFHAHRYSGCIIAPSIFDWPSVCI